ncbi:hypothetical protein EDB84DRAFT_1239185, partial [Lactarius hengduanensis]
LVRGHASKYTAPAIIIILVLCYLTWEPHIEVTFYRRSWIRQEIEPIHLSTAASKPDQASPLYNVTERLYGPKSTEVHAGLPMRLG